MNSFFLWGTTHPISNACECLKVHAKLFKFPFICSQPDLEQQHTTQQKKKLRWHTARINIIIGSLSPKWPRATRYSTLLALSLSSSFSLTHTQEGKRLLAANNLKYILCYYYHSLSVACVCKPKRNRRTFVKIPCHSWYEIFGHACASLLAISYLFGCVCVCVCCVWICD